ncbi:MAG: leucyl/phenylalanyl-tRNA--protein transferase [Alphaproteobacteria bacterium]|nr:leucyl/phenylalanyl-tRNA--protein transferase [Alphaproteobacteria bacterium]
MHGSPPLTPEIVLRAYAEGIFPMAERRGDTELFWVSPERRGIIPLDAFHIPKRLKRTVRSDRFSVTTDLSFVDVMMGCAAPAPDRDESWINAEILRLYTALHASGYAHSVETRLDGKLVGGLYGVALGAAFFGESMFSRETDASKVALVHLVARLKAGGFELLDTQFLTAHLARFGTIEIPRDDYLSRLRKAIARPAFWSAPVYWSAPSGSSTAPSLSVESGDLTLTGARDATAGAAWPGALVLQKIAQTS